MRSGQYLLGHEASVKGMGGVDGNAVDLRSIGGLGNCKDTASLVWMLALPTPLIIVFLSNHLHEAQRRRNIERPCHVTIHLHVPDNQDGEGGQKDPREYGERFEKYVSKRRLKVWGVYLNEDGPPWKYPKFSCTFGSQQSPATDGLQSFSSGRHWRFMANEKLKLTAAFRKMKTPSRILHCRALPRRPKKKRQIEILAKVALMRYHG